jgi:hypothetical protein
MIMKNARYWIALALMIAAVVCAWFGSRPGAW